LIPNIINKTIRLIFMVRPPALAFALIRVVDAANSVVESGSKISPDVCASLAYENMIAASWNEPGRQSHLRIKESRV
jgi:hypothetical protein